MTYPDHPLDPRELGRQVRTQVGRNNLSAVEDLWLAAEAGASWEALGVRPAEAQSWLTRYGRSLLAQMGDRPRHRRPAHPELAPVILGLPGHEGRLSQLYDRASERRIIECTVFWAEQEYQWLCQPAAPTESSFAERLQALAAFVATRSVLEAPTGPQPRAYQLLRRLSFTTQQVEVLYQRHALH